MGLECRLQDLRALCARRLAGETEPDFDLWHSVRRLRQSLLAVSEYRLRQLYPRAGLDFQRRSREWKGRTEEQRFQRCAEGVESAFRRFVGPEQEGRLGDPRRRRNIP